MKQIDFENFYKRIIKGEYDSYSPFVNLLCECIVEKNYFIIEVDSNSYSILNQYGFKKANCTIGNTDNSTEFNIQSLEINGAFVKLKKADKVIKQCEVDDKQSSKKIIDLFSKEDPSVYKTFVASYQKLLKAIESAKDGFDKLIDESLKNIDHRTSFNSLLAFFELTFPEKLLRNQIKNWLLTHIVISEIFTKINIVSRLKNDECYEVLEKTIEGFNLKNEHFHKNLTELIDGIDFSNIEHIDIFLKGFINDLSLVFNEKRRQSNKIESLLWIKAIQKKLPIDKQDILFINSTSEVILSSLGQLSASDKNTYYIYHDQLPDYYLTVSKIGTNRDAINIKSCFADLLFAKPTQSETQQQNLFFSNKKYSISLPNTNKFDLIIKDVSNSVIRSTEDDVNYKTPTNTGIDNRIEQYYLSKEQVAIPTKFINLLRFLRVGTDYLKNEGELLYFLPNHTIYNTNLNTLRKALEKDFNIIRGTSISNSIVDSNLIFQTKKNSTATEASNILLSEVGYKQLLDVLEAGEELEFDKIQPENGNWIHTEYQNYIALSDNDKGINEGIFSSKTKGVFSKENKIPDEVIQDTLNKEEGICIQTNPFVSQQIKELSQVKDEFDVLKIPFEEPNLFITTGFNSNKNKLEVLASKYVPYQHIFSRTKVYPFYASSKEKTININEVIYRVFRNYYAEKLNTDFEKFILEKDKSLLESVSTLVKHTKNFPALFRYANKLDEILNENKGKRLILYLELLWENIADFESKVIRFLRDARERKGLLLNTKRAINHLQIILRDTSKEEISFQKKLSFISRENIFFYVYGILNSDNYLTKYQYFLKYESPRIPLKNNFYQWSIFGKKLFDLHTGNFSEKLNLKIIETEHNNIIDQYSNFKFSIHKKIGSVIISDIIEVSGIPFKVWEYQIKDKSPLEWYIFNCKKEYKNTAFNRKLADEIIAEIERFCFLSLESQKLIQVINSELE
ncbi:type ISP restriction/modification enzyme [Chondrinema litorale]|uniref:type ISP restriction/modification enzyme n=1 Tax=Chondrinema litorale TaxID=2994555 RepID=UPI002542C47C|nr:type ISP restriction/modification enzyme [Chondrinema litorale]UZR92400.1 hypothetical protein OQ292_11065 [Chondrinema litorale]